MGIKILLADDSATAQNMGKKILTEAGHEVVTVSNGAAAAKKIAEVKPNLVLLDVFMPGYSGLELCERLRAAAETAKLPVLLTVGRMEPYNPQDGARVKADGIIVKPFEASDLIAAVDRFAQKLAPAKKTISDIEETLKIAPPADSRNESHEKPAPPAPEASDSKNYERTMRLDASQIAAMLNSASAAKQQASDPAATQEFSVPAAEPGAGEFHVAAPAFAEDVEASASATFVSDQSEHQPVSMPSYMDQYLSEEPAFAMEPTPAESAPISGIVEPTVAPEQSVADQLAPTMALSNDLLLHRVGAELSPEVPVASADGLELTAAASVPDVPTAKEPGFEPTLQSAETPTIVMKDPAFVSDPHAASMDFATQFGITEQPVSPEFAGNAESSTPDDDFEARLNAVMASSYDEPGTDLPMLDSPADAASEAPAIDFQAKLDQAMQAFHAPAEPAVEAVPAEAAGLETSHVPTLSEEPSTFSEPETVVAHSEFAPSAIEAAPSEPEAPAFSAAAEYVSSYEEPAVVDAVSSTVIPASEPEQASVSIEAVAAPDTDADVIEQMRDARSHLPVDSSHAPEPMAMAAAAGIAPVTAPTPLGREGELEIASALSAAMSMDSPVAHAESSAPDQPAGSHDANSVAAAVENVMKRELPNLIWKIMAEMDLRKR